MSTVHSKTILKSIPQGHKRGWALTVNGQTVPEVENFTLENPAFGTLTYGLQPAGYDGWTFHENGGGGSVIVPHFLSNGEVYVGLLTEERPTQGGLVLNLPRGFIEIGETHFQAAQREAGEEMSLKETTKRPLSELLGTPANPNSAFFESWGLGEGVRFFGLRFEESDIVRNGDELTLNASLLQPTSDQVKQKALLEKIVGKARFVPWHTAILCSDMFTVAGTGRLMGSLRSSR